MTAVENPYGGAPREYPPAPALRAPGEGECEFCGHTPATQVAFQCLTSFVVLYTISTRRAWMCRSCGIAVHRTLTARMLLGGWWGVGALGIPMMLLINRVRLRRVLRLEPPQGRLPEVTASLPAPLDPGRPVLRRPGGILSVVICTLLVLFVLVGVLAPGR